MLKCLGQLALLIHDGKAGSLTLEHDDCSAGFAIEQDDNDGDSLLHKSPSLQ
jgi:hypothetical protein